MRNIDLKCGMLHIEQAFSSNTITLPKSGRDRWVPLDPRLVPILAAAVDGKSAKEYVVIRETGKPPRRQHVWNELRALQDSKGLPRRSVHSLRHAFCTNLLRRGADVETVRLVAGHEDMKTTARYLHSDLEQARRIMQCGSLMDPHPTLN